MKKFLAAIILCLLLPLSLSGLTSCAEKDEEPQPKKGWYSALSLDGKTVFENLNPNGEKMDFYPSTENIAWDEILANTNHIQGMAVWKEYVIININGYYNDTGIVYVFNKDSIKKKFYTKNPVTDIGLTLPHSGGMQTVGDYLFIPMSGASGKQTQIYDLSPLENDEEPTLYQTVNFDEMDAGCVGGTIFSYNGRERIVICDGFGNLAAADKPEGDALPNWQLLTPENGSENPSVVNNVNMFTDNQGKVYILSFQSYGDGVNEKYTDKLFLYSVDFPDASRFIIKEIGEKSVKVADDHMLFLASHFRFAATLNVDESGELTVYSTPSLPFDATNGLKKFLFVNIFKKSS